METTVQTDRTIPNNKLIIVHKNKKLTYPAHLGNNYYQREADRIPKSKDLKIEAQHM